jgi:hypothetical protein
MLIHLRKKMRVAATLAVLAFTPIVSPAFAQGTAFTYQGRLSSGTNFANGSYDLAFSLYAAGSGGAAISGPVTNAAVGVTNGLFTTTVDFGNAFTGASNWVQIAVSTNGANAFGTLSPRQQLTPVPYAIFATTASNLSGSISAAQIFGQLPGNGLGGTYSGSVNLDSPGNSFTGNGANLTALNASQLATGTVADARLSSNVALRAGGNAFTGNQIISSGSVGIGTGTPAKQLDVTGAAAGVAAGTSIDPSIFVRINNTATDGTTSTPDFAGIGFGHNSTQQAIVGGTFGNDYLDFYTGGLLTGPQMRIDYNGTVGIVTNHVLEFGYGLAGKETSAGKIGYETFTSDSLDIVGAGTASSNRKIKFWAEGGANFNGNVGIGTTTPQHTLDVNGNLFFGKQANGQVFTEIGDTLYLGSSRKYLGNTLGAPVNGSTDWVNLMAHPLSKGIMFGTSGPSDADPHSAPNPLMIIQSNGNVGIGTTNATSQLTVNGFGSPAISLIGNGNSAGGQLDFGLAGFATAFSTSANASDAVIRQSGTGKLFLQTGSGGAAITINTNNSVGIGTSNPSSTLQVNGTVAASALRAPGAGINTGTFAFIQRAVSTNSSGNVTFIFNPVCDGDPNAILIVTHNWTADTNSTSKYNTTPVGVYYTGANWAIFNEDSSAMQPGRAFNVMVIKN